MQDFITTFKDFVVDLSDKHGVDPVLIFFLYLSSKVSLVFCLGWAVNNIRLKRAFQVPLLLAGVSFCIPYTYLIVVGRNISLWVYIVIGFIFIFSAYSVWRKVAVKIP